MSGARLWRVLTPLLVVVVTATLGYFMTRLPIQLTDGASNMISVADVRAWQFKTGTDLAAFLFAVAVVVGGHTFPGTIREAFPINHFLMMAVCTLGVAVLASERARVRNDLLASGMDGYIRPLVAAAYTGNDGVVGVALREGASLPPDEARTAACWLAGRGLETISGMLAPTEWSPGACQSAGGGSGK